jgi:hypothetical protein
MPPAPLSRREKGNKVQRASISNRRTSLDHGPVWDWALEGAEKCEYGTATASSLQPEVAVSTRTSTRYSLRGSACAARITTRPAAGTGRQPKLPPANLPQREGPPKEALQKLAPTCKALHVPFPKHEQIHHFVEAHGHLHQGLEVHGRFNLRLLRCAFSQGIRASVLFP